MRYRAERHDMVRRVAEGQEKIHSVQGRFFIHRLQNVGATGLQRSWTDNILWHHTTHLVDIGLWTVGGGDMTTVEDRIRNVYAAYPASERARARWSWWSSSRHDDRRSCNGRTTPTPDLRRPARHRPRRLPRRRADLA
jgi:hypothetical protein